MFSKQKRERKKEEKYKGEYSREKNKRNLQSTQLDFSAYIFKLSLLNRTILFLG